MMELKKEVKRAVRKAVADEDRESTEEGKRAVRAEGVRKAVAGGDRGAPDECRDLQGHGGRERL